MKVYIYKCEIAEIPDYKPAYEWALLNRVPNISDYSTVENFIQFHEQLTKPIERLCFSDDTFQNLVVAEKYGPLSNYLLGVERQRDELIEKCNDSRSLIIELRIKNTNLELYNSRFRNMNFIQRLQFLLTKRYL